MADDGEAPRDQTPAGGPAGAEGGQPVPVRGYRTPRYSVFLVSGGLLGLVAGLFLATAGAAPGATGGSGVVGYFAVFGAFLGALAGGTVAVLAESLLNRAGRGRGRRPPGGSPPG